MALSKKQIITTIFTLAIIFAIPIAVFLSQKNQTLRSKALQGKANFLLSTDSITSTVGKDINVLVSLQLTDPALKVSGVDFMLLYDKALLEVGNIVPNVVAVDPKAPFTDAPIVTSGGSFDDKFNFVRVTELARRPDNALPGGTSAAIKLANITFRGRGTGGKATIKFPDDNKYLEVSGTGTLPSITSGGPTITPGGPTPVSIPSPISWWKMDETSGQAVADSSGKGNNGTATGTTIVDGKVNKARSFNGASDYINASNPAPGATAITASFWMYPTRVGTGSGVNGYSSDPIWEAGDLRNGFYFEYRNSGSFELGTYVAGTYTPFPITTIDATGLNKWYHIACTITANGPVKCYLNGNLTLNSTIGNWNNGTNQFRIGPYNLFWSPNWYNQFFQGRVDEVRIYNRALSADEVQTLYNVTSTNPIPTPTVSAVTPGGQNQSCLTTCNQYIGQYGITSAVCQNACVSYSACVGICTGAGYPASTCQSVCTIIGAPQ